MFEALAVKEKMVPAEAELLTAKPPARDTVGKVALVVVTITVRELAAAVGDTVSTPLITATPEVTPQEAMAKVAPGPKSGGTAQLGVRKFASSSTFTLLPCTAWAGDTSVMTGVPGRTVRRFEPAATSPSVVTETPYWPGDVP